MQLYLYMSHPTCGEEGMALRSLLFPDHPRPETKPEARVDACNDNASIHANLDHSCCCARPSANKHRQRKLQIVDFTCWQIGRIHEYLHIHSIHHGEPRDRHMSGAISPIVGHSNREQDRSYIDYANQANSIGSTSLIVHERMIDRDTDIVH
jgi:hypothetical protein